MKKIIITMLMTIVLGSGFGFSQNYKDTYENYAYADYEYRLSNADVRIERYKGPIYYFEHNRANVYFVLVGNETFIVPAMTFKRYIHRHNFQWTPKSTFIALSGGGLDYYDSYLRFNFYFNFCDNYGWDQQYHTRLRNNFRNYYTHRRDDHSYDRNRQKIVASFHQEQLKMKRQNNSSITRSQNTGNSNNNGNMRNYRKANNYDRAQEIKSKMTNNWSSNNSGEAHRYESQQSQSTTRSMKTASDNGNKKPAKKR